MRHETTGTIRRPGKGAYEGSIGMREREVTISSGHLTLGGTLAWRETGGARPGVLLISGSGANDRDETVGGHKPFKRLSDFLASRGFAVLRYDDRGVGASEGCVADTGFEDAVDDAVAAARTLRGSPAVNGRAIALCGHSEGGLVAAAAAGKAGDAVVMLATPCSAIEEVLHYQAAALSREAGASEAQIIHERRMNSRVFAAVRAARDREAAFAAALNLIHAHLVDWPERPSVWGSDEDLMAPARIMAATVADIAYRTLLHVDPPSLIAAVDQPLLAVFGGRDQQTPHPLSIDAFKAVRHDRSRTAAVLFESLNHLLQHADTGAISEYESLGASPADEALECVGSWLEGNIGPIGRE